MTNNSNNSSSILGILAFGIVGVAVYFFGFKKPSHHQNMMSYANEWNERAPLLEDRVTQFDSVIVPDKWTIQYYYTFLEKGADEIDVKALEKLLRPRVTRNVKTDTSLIEFRNKEVMFEFYYKDKQNRRVIMIDVPPAVYNVE